VRDVNVCVCVCSQELNKIKVRCSQVACLDEDKDSVSGVDASYINVNQVIHQEPPDPTILRFILQLVLSVGSCPRLQTV
jgi:hypothetical protein